jgi:hypothetical protein
MKHSDLVFLLAYLEATEQESLTLEEALDSVNNLFDSYHKEDDEYQHFNDEEFKATFLQRFNQLKEGKFSYFEAPISEVSDEELIRWYIMFCNGADYRDPISHMEYRMFRKEQENRDKEFNEQVDYIDSVI